MSFFDEALRDTAIYIDLDALRHNIRNIKKLIGPQTALNAVIKADGYGHGAVKIAKTIMESGGDYLSVATLPEGMELRSEYDYPVLIMGHTPDRYLHHAVENDLTLTVFTEEQAAVLNEIAGTLKKKARVHLKVDTGFHRLGMDACEDPATVAEAFNRICALPFLDVEGIYSHLALAGEEEDMAQFRLFRAVADAVQCSGMKYRHIADSIAAVDYPDFRLDMVRAGALIYGMQGFTRGSVDVKQIMTFKTRISQLHRIPAGSGVSYDYLWRAEKDSIIATLPFGYADGYPRNMRGKGYVTVKGVTCPLVGVLCMDQVMADVTALGDDVKAGDEAVIYGSGVNEMTVAEAAALASTNKNELLSRITRRPRKIYVDEKRE